MQGEGRYMTGELGSPLVALQTLLNHSHRDRLLSSSTFTFQFIERNDANLQSLKRELRALGQLPHQIQVDPQRGDCFTVLKRLLTRLRESGEAMAPAFVFVDPYGFKVPGSILRDLMQAGRVELFVNLMWRELDMAMSQARENGRMAGVIDEIFDGPDWRTRVASSSPDERADQAVDLLSSKLSGRWPTFVRMLGENRATRYLLLHLTNHDEGRDLMKDCVWKVCPEGGFFVRKTDDPTQQFLITPRPDLRPLSSWIREHLSRGPLRWSDLHKLARPTVWRDTHVNQVVRELQKAGVIAAFGKFTIKANPLLTCPPAERSES